MAVKIKVKAPGDPEEGVLMSKGRSIADDTADVRDMLTAFVGKGYTNLLSKDASDDYKSMQAILGPDQARKLVTHAFIFNQNPANKTMPVEQRIKSFYDAPAADENVQSVLGRVKSFGYGVLPGFRESANTVNKSLAGRIPPPVAVVDPEVQKIKLKVAAKTQ